MEADILYNNHLQAVPFLSVGNLSLTEVMQGRNISCFLIFVAQKKQIMQITQQDHNDSGILENTTNYYYRPKPLGYENNFKTLLNT